MESFLSGIFAWNEFARQGPITLSTSGLSVASSDEKEKKRGGSALQENSISQKNTFQLGS